MILRPILHLLSLASVACLAMPTQVIIIRHAERYPFTGAFAGQLDPEGLRRAGALSSFFTLSDPDTTNVPLLVQGPPDAIFAARSVTITGAVDTSIRCLQTISATASTLGLPIHTGFTLGQESALAQLILESPLYDQKNILICWHSGNLPTLINALGYSCPYTGDTYPLTRFDLVWFLPTFPSPSPSTEATLILQELLYSDSSTPPP